MAQELPQESGQAGPQGAEAPAQAQGGGKLTQLMSQTFNSLNMLASAVGQTGNQELAAKLAAIKQQFEDLVEGGDQESPAPAGPGMGAAPVEVGATKARQVL